MDDNMLRTRISHSSCISVAEWTRVSQGYSVSSVRVTAALGGVVSSKVSLRPSCLLHLPPAEAPQVICPVILQRIAFPIHLVRYLGTAVAFLKTPREGQTGEAQDAFHVGGVSTLSW